MTLLKVLLRQTAWTPLQNNIAACCLTVLYCKIALEGIAWLRLRFGMTATNYSKQLVYILLASCILFWPLFDRADWSWRLNAVLPASMFVRFVYKGAIQKDPEDTEVQTLSRSSSPSELLFGPVQLAGILVLLGLYRFMTDEAAVVTAALGVGDAIAPIAGSLYGRHVYQMPLGQPKTMEGSVCGVFLGTCSASYFFLYCLGVPLLPLRIVLAYAGIAAVVEGTAPGNMDNLAVPVILHFSMDRVQQWLSA